MESYNFGKDEVFAQQFKAFLSLGKRRTGRTWLLIKACIENSIESGHSVHIFDHLIMFPDFNTQSHQKQSILFKVVQDVLKDYESKGIKIGFTWTIAKGQTSYSFSLNMDSIDAYRKHKIKEFELPNIKVEKIINKKLLLLLLCH